MIEIAKFDSLDSQANLEDIFARTHDHKIYRIDELLPWSLNPFAGQTVDA